MLSLARDTSLWRTHSSCGCLIWVCIKPCLESVLDRRGTHWPLPFPAELLTTDPLWKRQHQGLRLCTQWWEFQNLGHTDVSDQVQWVTKQTKRHEHENGARRDEGCVCDGAREIKDGGDGVPTMHHMDTWSYQATNLMNLKVGLGWKVRLWLHPKHLFVLLKMLNCISMASTGFQCRLRQVTFIYSDCCWKVDFLILIIGIMSAIQPNQVYSTIRG